MSGIFFGKIFARVGFGGGGGFSPGSAGSTTGISSSSVRARPFGGCTARRGLGRGLRMVDSFNKHQPQAGQALLQNGFLLFIQVAFGL